MSYVRVKLYSVFRDVAGLEEISVGCPKRLGDLLDEIRSTRLERAFSLVGDGFMVIDDEGSRIPHDQVIECGRTIHLIPSPSGGDLVVEVGVLKRGDAVDINALVERLSRSSSDTGAVAVFVGSVRGLNRGKRVEMLYYDHVEGALERVMESIAREEAGKWGLRGVAIYHYVGERRPGEYTLIVAVSGVSRTSVYPALESIVERVKREAPVFKIEYREGETVYMIGDREVKAPKAARASRQAG